MKNLIVILLLFISSLSFGQAKVYPDHNDNAPTFSVKFPDLDSLSYPYYSDWFDMSALMGQTVYLSDSIYSAAASQADTLRIIIEGRNPVRSPTGTTYLYEQLDTLFLAANLSQPNTLSLSSFSKDVRLRINDGTTGSGAVNTSNIQAWFYVFANTTNYLRERKGYGYLP